MNKNHDSGLYNWIKREEENGNIYQEIDGMWVWCPTFATSYGGFLDEYALTKMVEYLTARNAFWNWVINNDPAVGGTVEDESVPSDFEDLG
jgi:hypothetical protein